MLGRDRGEKSLARTPSSCCSGAAPCSASLPRVADPTRVVPHCAYHGRYCRIPTKGSHCRGATHTCSPECVPHLGVSPQSRPDVRVLGQSRDQCAQGACRCACACSVVCRCLGPVAAREECVPPKKLKKYKIIEPFLLGPLALVDSCTTFPKSSTRDGRPPSSRMRAMRRRRVSYIQRDPGQYLFIPQ